MTLYRVTKDDCILSIKIKPNVKISVKENAMILLSINLQYFLSPIHYDFTDRLTENLLSSLNSKKRVQEPKNKQNGRATENVRNIDGIWFAGIICWTGKPANLCILYTHTLRLTLRHISIRGIVKLPNFQVLLQV